MRDMDADFANFGIDGGSNFFGHELNHEARHSG
jgi:hypothetical protein